MFSIDKKARQYGIPSSLAHALIGQESGGSPTAVSSAGATGLTQVMPSTAAGMYGITESAAARRLRNPNFALDAGFRYLAAQKKTFGSWRLALAAYNAGPNAVREYGGVPPYDETENYVRSILGKAGVGTSPSSSPAGTVPELPTTDMPSSESTLPAFDPATFAQQNLQNLASGETFDPLARLSSRVHAQLSAPSTPTPDVVEPGATPTLPPVKVSGPVTRRVKAVIDMAQTYLGTPYVWGGEKPGGFDCSGLLQYVWGKAGVQIPRTTYDQVNTGTPVSKRNLKAGDAVFFGSADDVHHVGMYIGGGRFIEAPKTGDVVKISRIRGRSDFVTARRFA